MSIFPKHTRTILALFESSSDLSFIRENLSNPFYVYQAASSIPSALVALQKKHIDMIISGVHLENTDSYEFLNRVKADESLRTIPFVFISLRRSEVARCADRGLALAARALGAELFLSIDYHSPQEIRGQIARYFASHLNINAGEEAAVEEAHTIWSSATNPVTRARGNSFSY